LNQENIDGFGFTLIENNHDLPVSKSSGVSLTASNELSDKNNTLYTISNDMITLCLSATGEIISFTDISNTPSRELVHPQDVCGKIVMYDDIPFYWDAWDIMPYYQMTGKQINSSKGYLLGSSNQDLVNIDLGIKCSSRIESFNGAVTVIYSFESSSLTESKFLSPFVLKITVVPGSKLVEFELDIDWRESHKLLKVEFPFNISSPFVKYDIQYGYVQRPTHVNQPTDAAMFEVCGHRYADICETGYGIALINDSKYGYSARESTLCLSLLRSPKSPDPNCDMGRHSIKYALFPHLCDHSSNIDGNNVAHESILFNSPLVQWNGSVNATGLHQAFETSPLLRSISSSIISHGLFHNASNNLILDTIKLSERSLSKIYQQKDRETVILRFYEANGSRGIAKIRSMVPLLSANICNMKEEIMHSTSIINFTDSNDSLSFELHYSPFQIITVEVELQLVLRC
jgi:alpha-mannosidase